MKRFFIILALILVIFLGTLTYLGGFKKMTVDEVNMNQFFYMYKTHKGSYRKIGKLFKELNELKKSKKLNSNNFIGVYYDDPNEIPEEQLRAEAGISLLKNEYDEFQKNPEFDKFQFRIIPPADYVHTTFKYSNTLGMILAIMKAYPALTEYLHKVKFYEDNKENFSQKKSYALEIYEPTLIHFYIKTKPTKNPPK